MGGASVVSKLIAILRPEFWLGTNVKTSVFVSVCYWEGRGIDKYWNIIGRKRFNQAILFLWIFLSFI